MLPFILFLAMAGSAVVFSDDVVDTSTDDSDGVGNTDDTSGATQSANAGDDPTGDNTDGDTTDTDGGDNPDVDTTDTDDTDPATTDTDDDDGDSDQDGLGNLEEFIAFFEETEGTKAVDGLDTSFESIKDTTDRVTFLPVASDVDADRNDIYGGTGNDAMDVEDMAASMGQDIDGWNIIGGSGDDLVTSATRSNVYLSGTTLPAGTETDTILNSDDVFHQADNGRDVAVFEAPAADSSSSSPFSTVHIDNGDEVFLETGHSVTTVVRFEPDAKVMLNGFNHNEHFVSLEHRYADDGAEAELVAFDTVDGVQILTYQNGFQLMFKDSDPIDFTQIATADGHNDDAAWGGAPAVDPYRITPDDVPTVSTGDAVLDGILNNKDVDVYIGSDNRDFVLETAGNPNIAEHSDGLITLENDTIIIARDGTDEIYGERGSDVIFGGDSDDDLNGSLRNPAGEGEFTQWEKEPDALFGGGGDDDLVLHAGDYGHGGEGGDSFTIVDNAVAATYTVLDFDKTEDTLSIEKSAQGDTLDVAITVSDGDTILTLSNGSQVILRGVTDFTPEADVGVAGLDTYFYVR